MLYFVFLYFCSWRWASERSHCEASAMPSFNADLYWLYLNLTSTPRSDSVGCLHSDPCFIVWAVSNPPLSDSVEPTHALLLSAVSNPTHCLSDIIVLPAVLLYCPNLIQDFTAAIEAICLLLHTLLKYSKNIWQFSDKTILIIVFVLFLKLLSEWVSLFNNLKTIPHNYSHFWTTTKPV